MTATYWVPVTAELWAETGQWPQLDGARFTGQTMRYKSPVILAQLVDDQADPALNEMVVGIDCARTDGLPVIVGRTIIDERTLPWAPPGP